MRSFSVNVKMTNVEQVKSFMDTVDELRRWMDDYSRRLKMVKMPGALPESAQKEFDKFMVCLFSDITAYFVFCCC